MKSPFEVGLARGRRTGVGGRLKTYLEQIDVRI